MKNEIIRFVVIILAAGALAFGASPNGQIFFGKLMAQVGITVGIAPNPYNTLDAQLNAKQAQLDAESADLAAREAAFASSTATASAATAADGWYSWVALGILGLLVALNFLLDWRRNHKAPSEGGTIK